MGEAASRAGQLDICPIDRPMPSDRRRTARRAPIGRHLLPWLLGLALLPGPACAAPPKVLRIASFAETSFDPARVGDGYSDLVNAHLFESLYGYDPLRRDRVVPRSAAALPEVSADFRTWTVRLQPGIRFADDPAFGGRPRELTAADYVYSIKRLADPANRSPRWSTVEQYGIVGLAALRRDSVSTGRPFDYDRPIEGLQALDRHTLRFRLEAPRPRFLYLLADAATLAVAREVIERRGGDVGSHPVGTGPFRLAAYRPASLIVLERNPHYRDARYRAEPAADDAEAQATLRRLRDRRLPMIDRVEIRVIEESQPQWLAFLNDELDVLELPFEFADVAVPNDRVAPYLARRGVRAQRTVRPMTSYLYFNMEDPVVGGYAPAQVALRRAVGLALDVEREIRLLQRGQARVAHQTIPPHLSGHDPAYRSEMGDYSPARAKALLDLYGWIDRDGDGWRDRPDGSPLLLQVGTRPDQRARASDELLRRDLRAIGIDVRFHTALFPELLKAARAGRLMVWRLSGEATAPDGQQGVMRYYGPASGAFNLARFRLPAMDALYERLLLLPDGPERDAVFAEARRLALVYMPYKLRLNPITTMLLQPRVVGYRRPVFGSNWFEFVDIDDGATSSP